MVGTMNKTLLTTQRSGKWPFKITLEPLDLFLDSLSFLNTGVGGEGFLSLIYIFKFWVIFNGSTYMPPPPPPGFYVILKVQAKGSLKQ